MNDDYKIYEPTYTHEQKDIAEHRFYIDDIIYVLMQMRKDGYRYASLSVVEDCQDDDEAPCYACLFPTADDCGGYCGCDYDGVCEVPYQELSQYGFQGMEKPPFRMSFEFDDAEE